MIAAKEPDLSASGDTIAKRHLLRSFLNTHFRLHLCLEKRNYRRVYRSFLMRWRGETYQEIGRTMGFTAGRARQIFVNYNGTIRRLLKQANANTDLKNRGLLR